jgi:uncharacterized protein YcfL
MGAVGLLSGCAQNCVVIASGGNAPQTKVSTTSGDVEITQPASRLVTGDFTQAKVNVVNNTKKVQSVQYQFRWYSASGFPEGENTPWQPVVISPYSSQVVSDVSPTPNAVVYHVSVCRVE